MIFHCSNETCLAELPGKWQVLADGDRSDLWKKPKTAPKTVSVPAYTALILGQ